MNEQEVMATEALERVLEVVESIRTAGTTAFEAMILTKVPCNAEIMQLGMLLQASMSFSVALKQWIKLCEEQQVTIIEMTKKQGS